jgi:alkylation response protein AidB-like acyl-CoA dehydrogenase
MSTDHPIIDILADASRIAPRPGPFEHVTDWWPTWLSLTAEHTEPMRLAVAGGAQADRAAWAFAAGYQAAQRSLLRDLPGVPQGSTMSALCVTEEQGNKPVHIHCRLEPVPGGFKLFGDKRWSTLGPQSNQLLVAARLAPYDAARPTLRMVRVASDAPGVAFTLSPPSRFIPELPQARLAFNGAMIPDDAVLPGDGYERYIKPFGVVEDIHVSSAVLAYLLAEAARQHWPADWRERALIALMGFDALARLDPSLPLTQLALAGALSQRKTLTDEAMQCWLQTPHVPASQRWVRDAILVGGSGGARQQRTQRAWERMAMQ